MQPMLMIALAAAASVPLGLSLRHNLATLSYRNGGEQDVPRPGPRWWVVWASVLAVSSLTAAASLSGRPLTYLPLLPLAVAGPWLAAVDFDVMRLPNRALAPTAGTTLLAIAGVGTVTQDWRTLVVPATAALATGGVFAAIHFATKGGIGFGDVKLTTVIGLAVGPLGIGAVWLSVLTGSLAALIWAKASRKFHPIAYGPWLLCGSWIATFTATVASSS